MIEFFSTIAGLAFLVMPFALYKLLRKMSEGQQKKGWVYTLIASTATFCICMSIAVALGPPAQRTTNTKQAGTPTTDTVKQPEPAKQPETLDQQVKTFAEDKLGTKTNLNEYPNKVQSVVVSTDQTEVTITAIADDSLSNDLIKWSLYADSKEIFKNAFDKFSFNRVHLVYQFPLVNAKGNSKLGNIMLLTMSRANERDINWPEVPAENIPIIADSYWESPALSN